MPRTKASNAAQYRYNQGHIKRVPLDMQLCDYDALKAHADSTGESVNGFIKRAISAAIHSAPTEAPAPAQPAQPAPEGVPVYLPTDAYSAAKGQKEVIQAHAEAQGESVADYTARAIHTQAERDSVLRRIRDSVTH